MIDLFKNFKNKIIGKVLYYLIGEPRDPDERDILLDIKELIKKEE